MPVMGGSLVRLICGCMPFGGHRYRTSVDGPLDDEDMKMDELEAELAQFEKDVGNVSPNDVNPTATTLWQSPRSKRPSR